MVLRSFLLLVLFWNMASAQKQDISETIREQIQGKPIPAMAAAVVKQGEIVASGVAGSRKWRGDVPAELTDCFHLGSNSKAMTATLAARLVEAGRIGWDTTLAEVFAEVEMHPDYKEVSLHALLTNTGGCPGDARTSLWLELWEREGTEREQRMQLVRGILSKAPKYPPGKRNVYSNVSFAIAGAMLEEVCDEAYESLLRRELFEPLGMLSGGFRAPVGPDPVSQPYGHKGTWFGGLKAVDAEPQGDNPPGIAPAGAVHASIEDYARFVSVHLGAGPSGYLKSETLRFLQEPTTAGPNYACGWLVSEDEKLGTVLTHAGSNTMWFAIVWLAPEQDFGVVVACNSGLDSAWGVCDALRVRLMQRFLAQAEEKP